MAYIEVIGPGKGDLSMRWNMPEPVPPSAAVRVASSAPTRHGIPLDAWMLFDSPPPRERVGKALIAFRQHLIRTLKQGALSPVCAKRVLHSLGIRKRKDADT